MNIAARLLADCHPLGHFDGWPLLLMDKAEVTWLILVPETTVIEVCDLSAAEQTRLMAAITVLSRVLRERCGAQKLNVAAIGNLVPQLHIHVIGRRSDDPWWPQTAWGQPSTARYARERVDALIAILRGALGPTFSPTR